MSTADPTPGDDAAEVAENDRSYLMEQSPVEVDQAAVDANLAADLDEEGDEADDEPGFDAAAAQD